MLLSFVRLGSYTRSTVPVPPSPSLLHPLRRQKKCVAATTTTCPCRRSIYSFYSIFNLHRIDSNIITYYAYAACTRLVTNILLSCLFLLSCCYTTNPKCPSPHHTSHSTSLHSHPPLALLKYILTFAVPPRSFYDSLLLAALPSGCLGPLFFSLFLYLCLVSFRASPFLESVLPTIHIPLFLLYFLTKQNRSSSRRSRRSRSSQTNTLIRR